MTRPPEENRGSREEKMWQAELCRRLKFLYGQSCGLSCRTKNVWGKKLRKNPNLLRRVAIPRCPRKKNEPFYGTAARRKSAMELLPKQLRFRSIPG